MKYISPDVTEHCNPEFAVLLADAIGFREPLIDILRDHAEPLTPLERDYLAGVLADGPRRWPAPKTVDKSCEKLRRAAFYLEHLWKDGNCGEIEAALEHAAKKCICNSSTVQRSVKWAKALAGGKWWEMVEHLAKKGERKAASLHLTYQA